MDKNSEFDLINSSWNKSSSNDLFGGDSSFGGDSFSISNPVDSMSSPFGGLDDHHDILGSSSSLSGLESHRGIDDVMGTSFGSPSESAKPDVMQSTLSESDIFKDLHTQKDNMGSSETSDLLKNDFASGSSLSDFGHSLEHSLSKSDTGISFGTLGADLLGDYGSRDYQSEFLSGGLFKDTLKTEKETSPDVIDESKKDILENHADDTHSFSEHESSTLASSDDVSHVVNRGYGKVLGKDEDSIEISSDENSIEIKSDVHEVNRKYGKVLGKDEDSIEIESNVHSGATYKELVPVLGDVEIHNDREESGEVFLDSYDKKDVLKSDSIGAFNNASFESNWFGEYSNSNKFSYDIDDDFSNQSYQKPSRKEVDNYDYNYTGLQLSDVGAVAEEIEKYQTRENVGCGIIAVCVVLFFLSGIWLGFTLIGISGIVGASILSWHSGSQAKKLYKTYFVEQTLKKNFYLKMYQPNEVFGIDLHSLNLTDERWNRSKVDDVIDGLYKGVHFTFEDIALDYNSGGKNSTTKQIFRGQVYETSLKVCVPTSIRYVRRLEPLKDENGVLRNYMRYGDMDENAIRTIETPEFIEALNKFADVNFRALSEIRLSGKRMVIVINSMCEWFELKGKLDESVDLLNSQIREVMDVLQFMKNCGIVFDKCRAS